MWLSSLCTDETLNVIILWITLTGPANFKESIVSPETVTLYIEPLY